MINIAITGVAGRMGQEIALAALSHADIRVVAATERKEERDRIQGRDLGEFLGKAALGIQILPELNALTQDEIGAIHVVIDFTTPKSTMAHLALCQRHKKAIVIGTTGFSPKELQEIAVVASEIPVVLAPNMSVGVNLILKLLETTTQILGHNAEVEIIEAHHRYKKDAPSGTARKMGEVIAHSRGKTLDKCAVYDRRDKSYRNPDEIGFSVIRAGDIVGEHTALFITPEERIEITHKALNRSVFAQGAIRAARWLSQQSAGQLFDMQDVLGL